MIEPSVSYRPTATIECKYSFLFDYLMLRVEFDYSKLPGCPNKSRPFALNTIPTFHELHNFYTAQFFIYSQHHQLVVTTSSIQDNDIELRNNL